MNPLTSEKIRVKILGKEYELDPGRLTALEASQLATYVDDKMKEISEKLKIVDTQKIAVLAALNIAFELGSKKGQSEISLQDENKIQMALDQLEKVLRE